MSKGHPSVSNHPGLPPLLDSAHAFHHSRVTVAGLYLRKTVRQDYLQQWINNTENNQSL